MSFNKIEVSDYSNPSQQINRKNKPICFVYRFDVYISTNTLFKDTTLAYLPLFADISITLSTLIGRSIFTIMWCTSTPYKSC